MVAGGLVAASVSASAAVPAEFKPEWIPQIAVPRMTAAPVIDGTLDATEWREAAAVSGAAEGNRLIPRPTLYYLGWDAGHLYLACRTYLRPGYKPIILHGRADGLTYTFDDGMEMVWKPMGKNVINRNAAYKFFVNCLGYKGDTSRVTLGQMFKDWNPQFKTAYRLTDPGTAPEGGRWWELEMSCTPADFELKGDHRAGDEWRLMLGFNHIPAWTQARIPCLGSYFDDTGGGYPRATLVENTPGVQFIMDSLKNLATDGTAAMAIKLFNPTAAAAAIEVSVDVAGVIVKTETLDVPANGEATFKLDERLPADVVDGMVRVSATAAGKTLLSYTAFFQKGFKPEMLAPVKPRDPNQFEFRVNFSPVRRLLNVAGDTWFFDDPAAAAAMAWKVFPQGAPDKAIASGKVEQTVLWRFQELTELPELAVGKYTVEAVITMKDGGTRGPMSATIEKKDEAKEYPQWWGRRFGDADQVIPPFTAIREAAAGKPGEGDPSRDLDQPGRRFSVWGREYALTGLGLPAGLQSQGRAVLAAPARLVVVRDGQEAVVPLGAATVTEAKDWRVCFKGDSVGAGLAFHAEGWLEQDGLVYVSLTYGPQAKDPVAVEALRIEYPLAEEDADALVCIGPGGNYASMTAMLLPREKQGPLWSTLVTGQPGARMVRGSFYPTVWVGSERRGFVWWADNDRGWFPENDVPAHEVARAAGKAANGTEVVLCNHIIGKPVSLSEPRTIAFSYMATPFRPFTKGWRAVNATDDGTFSVPHRSVRLDSKTGQKVNAGGAQMNWIHPESRYPEEWDALWAKQKTTGDMGYGSADSWRTRQWYDPYAARNGIGWHHMSFTLHNYGPKTIEDNLLQYFAPSARWDDELDDTFINYAMYLFDGAFGKGGVVQTYWDITFPNQDTNPVGGMAYPLPDGRIQPGYIGWNARRFYQRLQALMATHKLVPDGNGGHSTQAYLTVAMPWMDAVLDGELGFDLDVSGRDWIDNYPVARMRSMSSPHNWGVPICWMGHLLSVDPKKAELARIARTEYIWLHDSWKNPYCGDGRVVMPDTLLDFGLNGDATAYHPYWRNPYVTSANKNLLVSLWRLADRDDTGMRAEPTAGPVERVLIGVFNYERAKEQEVTLTIDLQALGLRVPGTEVVARELYGPETGVASYYRGDSGNHAVPSLFAMECRLDAVSGTLSLPALPPHRGRYIGLRLERKPQVAGLHERLKALAAQAGAATPVEVPEAALVWGAAEPGAAFQEAGKVPGVTAAGPGVQAAAWVWPDRILLAVSNTGDKPATDSLGIDLDKLGLTPRLPWQEFVRLRDFGPVEGSVTLDFHGRGLKLKNLPPKSVRLVGIRRY